MSDPIEPYRKWFYMQVDMLAALTETLTQGVLQTSSLLAPDAAQIHIAIQADLTAAVAGKRVPAPFSNLNTLALGLRFTAGR
jgi:alkaline phosphatase D